MTRLPTTDDLYGSWAPRVWHYNDKNRPADAVYIGRAMPRQGLEGSPLGNPYKIVNRHGSFLIVYADGMLARGLIINTFERKDEATAYLLEIYRRWADPKDREQSWLDPLIGHDLVCWCAKKGHPLTADDPLVCHGQVLLKLIREREGK